jgi:hypothetical protein
MKVLGKAQMFAWGIVLAAVTLVFVESQGAEPTRALKLTTSSTSMPRVLVFKGISQAGQLAPMPQTPDLASKNAAPPAELSAAEASEALAAAGISITPAMLGSKKPFTLTPASPRLAGRAHIQFMNVSQGVLGGNSQGGFYYFSSPHEGGVRNVDLYVFPSALIVGKSYLVDFAVSCSEPASWRVYVPGGGQEINLQSGSQHIPVLVTWQGAATSSFHLTLSNLSAPWTFYSATVTELP